jgi:hypothetical protein
MMQDSGKPSKKQLFGNFQNDFVIAAEGCWFLLKLLRN